MIWGWNKDESKRFKFSERSEYLLGFNEPNHPNQAYMLPAEAATRWKDLEKAGRNNGALYFISPAAAPGGDNYLDWFDWFFGNCTNCQVDFLATHAYDCKAQTVMNFLTRLWDKFGKRIWLTEFACPGDVNVDKQLQFMKDLLPLLEEADFVDRYSWYCSRLLDPHAHVAPSASLLEANESRLTPLGEYYNSFTPTA